MIRSSNRQGATMSFAKVKQADGSFHYFMPPLPPGESLITITAQNAKGGVNTVQKKIVIQ